MVELQNSVNLLIESFNNFCEKVERLFSIIIINNFDVYNLMQSKGFNQKLPEIDENHYDEKKVGAYIDRLQNFYSGLESSDFDINDLGVTGLLTDCLDCIKSAKDGLLICKNYSKKQNLFILIDKIKSTFYLIREKGLSVNARFDSSLLVFDTIKELIDRFELVIENGIFDESFLTYFYDRELEIKEEMEKIKAEQKIEEEKNQKIKTDFENKVISINSKSEQLLDFENFVKSFNSNYLNSLFTELEDQLIYFNEVYGSPLANKNSVLDAEKCLEQIEGLVFTKTMHLVSEIEYLKHNINEIIDGDNSLVARKILIENLSSMMDSFENNFKNSVISNGYFDLSFARKLIEAYNKLLSMENVVEKAKPSLYNPTPIQIFNIEKGE